MMVGNRLQFFTSINPNFVLRVALESNLQ